MKKIDIYNKSLEILNSIEFEDEFKKELIFNKFEVLLKPKNGGISKRKSEFLNDVEYFYCRFTGLYYIKENMVYQNQDKKSKNEDKGYSTLGIKLWNKGQKYLKNLKIRFTEIAYLEDKNDEKLQKEGLNYFKESQKLEKDNSTNDYVYLMDNFLESDDTIGLKIEDFKEVEDSEEVEDSKDVEDFKEFEESKDVEDSKKKKKSSK